MLIEQIKIGEICVLAGDRCRAEMNYSIRINNKRTYYYSNYDSAPIHLELAGRGSVKKIRVKG